ncbi:MAG: dTDP-glucose 4,6-dehydratase [Candidatus Aminicenantia bacterium]
MSKFLISGGAGFIGSNLIHYLLRNYEEIEIICLDKLTYAGNLENLKSVKNDRRFKFIKGDIKDREHVRELLKEVEIIIHLAAETHVDRSILYPEDFIYTDIVGTYVLLDEAKGSKIKIFLHVSTDEVYGSIDEGSFHENSPLNPSSPYSASKAGADRLAYAYFKTFSVPVIIVRPCNNYGPFQFPEKFIPLFITNALENKELPLYGDGKNVRDWLFVEDCCSAILTVLEKGLIGEVYNIGAGYEAKNIEVAKLILKYTEKSEKLIKFVKDRPAHDRRYSLNWSKIKELGWRPKVGIEEGLKKTVEWYKENFSWWKRIKEESEEFRKFYKSYYGQ